MLASDVRRYKHINGFYRFNIILLKQGSDRHIHTRACPGDQTIFYDWATVSALDRPLLQYLRNMTTSLHKNSHFGCDYLKNNILFPCGKDHYHFLLLPLSMF
jgi:hypothetical protein